VLVWPLSTDVVLKIDKKLMEWMLPNSETPNRNLKRCNEKKCPREMHRLRGRFLRKVLSTHPSTPIFLGAWGVFEGSSGE